MQSVNFLSLIAKCKTRLNKSYSLSFSWASVLTFASFWTYGYMAAVSVPSFFEKLVVTLSLLCLVVFFWSQVGSSHFADKLTASKWDLLSFISYGLLLFLLSPRELFYDLQGDQLFHAQYAHVHAVKALRNLGTHLQPLLGIRLSLLVWGVNVVLLLSGFLAILLLRGRSNFTKIVVLSLSFLILRGGLLALGGNVDVHPVLRLFPLWLSTTLFSISNFAFRLPQFIALLLAMTYVAKQARSFNSPLISWLVGVALGTIPLFWHVGLLVEASIWSTVGLLFLFVEIHLKGNDIRSLNFMRLASVLSLFSLMRQPTFAGFIPLGLLAVIAFFQSERRDRRSLFWAFTPVLAMLPSFLYAVLQGTPSSQALTSQPNSGVLQQVWFAIESGLAFKAIVNSVFWIPFLFFVFAFVPTPRRNRSVIANLVGFAVLLLLFYSVARVFWGTGRYQAEYTLPFIAVGILRFVETFKQRVSVIGATLVAIILWNVFTFKNLNSLNPPVDVRKVISPYKTHVLSQLIYPYGEAMTQAKREGYAGKLHVAGWVYGGFSEIIHGYTLGEYIADFNLMTSVKREQNAGRAANRFDNVQLILISDLPDPNNALVAELEEQGWERWRSFRDLEHGSTIMGYVRRGEP